MAPAMNLLRPTHCDGYSSAYFDDSRRDHEQASGLMADKATGTSDGHEEGDKIGKEASKVDGDDGRGGWLQLSIGGGRRSNYPKLQDPSPVLDPSSSNGRNKGDPPEFHLFCRRPSEPPPTLAPPLFPAIMGGYCHQWPEYPSPSSTARTFTPSSSSRGQFMCPSARFSSPLRLDGEMRVVSQPRRPQTGMWLVLQAAQDQVKEPFLPQIPKSYLRIKDGRMTIRLLMRYLASKLGLEDDSQVEITCRGQQLSPFLTLIYVRDNIWCSLEAVELHTDTSSTKYVMNLLYRSRGRCR
ncbi:protein LAX PANICLE 2-like [Musa acuminata AAA Group]|uniref:protein LAX PANICLE 2-like n=1 Tax=Musa acuminata AAA Group TaxID=214697 RepID=UPI0031CF6779